MTLTRYGIKEWGLSLAGALLLLGLSYFLWVKGLFFPAGFIVAGFAILQFFCIAFFFRNPKRNLPNDAGAILSPADGLIKDIEIMETPDVEGFEGKALRIGIFLSVLNVHVNRAPDSMDVKNVHYRKGEYLDARHNEASKRNEAMTISGSSAHNQPMAVRQISGAIARRIVCPVKAGKSLKKGQIYGMIKFGSRTELYLPAEAVELRVKPGDKVRGGTSIMGFWKGQNS